MTNLLNGTEPLTFKKGNSRQTITLAAMSGWMIYSHNWRDERITKSFKSYEEARQYIEAKGYVAA